MGWPRFLLRLHPESEEDLPGWLELSEWAVHLGGCFFKERAGWWFWWFWWDFYDVAKILASLGPEAIFLGHDLIPPPWNWQTFAAENGWGWKFDPFPFGALKGIFLGAFLLLVFTECIAGCVVSWSSANFEDGQNLVQTPHFLLHPVEKSNHKETRNKKYPTIYIYNYNLYLSHQVFSKTQKDPSFSPCGRSMNF